MEEQDSYYIVAVFYRGVLWHGPHLTRDVKKARKLFKDYCKEHGLPVDDPHDGETDVYWWEIKPE